MSELTQKKCVPCEGGVAPLTLSEAEKLLTELSGWTLSPEAKQITKSYRFKNFAEALLFVNKIGALAESEGHHPDLTLSWGKVDVVLTTHSIKGLSVNDFILAAKIDCL
jgi:4a-hydroxytetrahydrobiopterin dehydratase